MRDVLLLRFDAPLMSFGAPTVDALGRTARHPSRSMLAGLLGNALGWDHADWAKLQAMQERLRWAARLDRDGQPLTEYQTVDLGQPHLLTKGKEAVSWTTRGRVEERRGGEASTGTHQRWRDHWADALYTVAVGLDGDGHPGIAEVAQAVRHPARPLFLGRKACLPAAPLYLGIVQSESLAAALLADWQDPTRRVHRDSPGPRPIWWPGDEPHPQGDSRHEELFVTEERDWRNQIHVGERRILHGLLRRDTATGSAT
jgi:CRISPR system Cascade subunit CasD